MKKKTFKRFTLSLVAAILTFSMIGTPVAEAKRSKGSSSKSSYSSSKSSYKSSRGSYNPSGSSSSNTNSSTSSSNINNSTSSGSTSNGSSNINSSTSSGSTSSSSSNINSSTSSGSTSSSSSNNTDTSWKEKISSISRSDLKYSSPYSGSSYKPSGNYNYSSYSGKPYYKSSSGFATTLLTAAGTYFVLSHFLDSDPVYVNAETGEEIDIDDYSDDEIQAVEVETEAAEEDVTNESTTALIPEENTETTESATAVTETIQEEVEKESPIVEFFNGLLGLAVIAGIWMYIRNRKKKRRA